MTRARLRARRRDATEPVDFAALIRAVHAGDADSRDYDVILEPMDDPADACEPGTD